MLVSLSPIMKYITYFEIVFLSGRIMSDVYTSQVSKQIQLFGHIAFRRRLKFGPGRRRLITRVYLRQLVGHVQNGPRNPRWTTFDLSV